MDSETRVEGLKKEVQAEQAVEIEITEEYPQSWPQFKLDEFVEIKGHNNDGFKFKVKKIRKKEIVLRRVKVC